MSYARPRDILIFAGTIFLLSGCASVPTGKILIVNDPICDIRREPVDKKTGYEHDSLQETQVLFNEVLKLESSQDDWYRITAEEQKKYFPDGRWRGYPGYIRKRSVRAERSLPAYDAVVKDGFVEVFDEMPPEGRGVLFLSMGTRLDVVEKKNGFSRIGIGKGRFGWVDSLSLLETRANTRSNVLTAAGSFIGSPYLWGGRSFYMPFAPRVTSGVDCSGLVNLSYRVVGIDLPRDAGDQKRAAEPISADELQPADLVFVSAKGDPGRIVHVMLFAGKEEMIESPETGGLVRRISFKEKFGMTLSELEANGFIADARKICFGRVDALDPAPAVVR